jgi:hypothetical protein
VLLISGAGSFEVNSHTQLLAKCNRNTITPSLPPHSTKTIKLTQSPARTDFWSFFAARVATTLSANPPNPKAWMAKTLIQVQQEWQKPSLQSPQHDRQQPSLQQEWQKPSLQSQPDNIPSRSLQDKMAMHAQIEDIPPINIEFYQGLRTATV